MELKNADIITLKNGDTCVVAGDTVVSCDRQMGIASFDFFNDYYADTLNHRTLGEYDIAKVMRFDGFHEYKCVFERHALVSELAGDKQDKLMDILCTCIEFSKPSAQFNVIDKYLDLEVVDPDRHGFDGFICTAKHFDSAVDNLSALEILQMGSNSKPLNEFTDFYWVHDGIVEYGNKLLDLLRPTKYHALIEKTAKEIISLYDRCAETGKLPPYERMPEEIKVIADFMKGAE